jgi:hypothetical protein
MGNILKTYSRYTLDLELEANLASCTLVGYILKIMICLDASLQYLVKGRSDLQFNLCKSLFGGGVPGIYLALYRLPSTSKFQ